MSRVHPTLPPQHHPAALPTPTSSTSFWHTAPSPLLTAHRSTRALPPTADIVIIGSGMTGASAAHHLLTSTNPPAPALAVVMLEAREACWGATGRNGGHCQPLLFEHPHDPSIGRFELANFRALQALVADKGVECEFVAQPGVRALYGRHYLDEAEEALRVMETTAPDLRALLTLVTDKAELERLRISTAVGAVVTEVAGRMWPYKFVARVLEDLLGDCSLAGTFNLQTLTPVTSLTPHPPTARWTVTTPRGTILARRVILATNAYTSHLVPAFTNLIIPCRGQMSALHPPPALRGDARLTTSVGFLGEGRDDYLIQRPNEGGGHLMFGGGREVDAGLGVTDDSVVDEATAAYLRGTLVKALGLPLTPANEWSGIMAFSRDAHPFVGAVPGPEHAGLFVAAGYTGHGMPNAWLCGKAVALMAAGSLVGGGGDVDVEGVGEGVGLPRAYWVTGERMGTGMGMGG
ncbi:hypothetical protein LTR08_002341 [Meristemomyces frigidus]|nr:hypothetical protein LTR08_002341 [Meristemomyces frigidus]